MKLREEKGYTYGAGAGFDMRRGAGPFSARAAVNTEVTVPAIVDTLAELTRMRDGPVEEAELVAARDFLIGVFPLRFETAGAVVGRARQPRRPWPRRRRAHRIPREHRGGGRGGGRVRRRARTCTSIEASIVLVGDADAFEPELEAAGLGRIVIERDEGPIASGPIDEVIRARADRRRERDRTDRRRGRTLDPGLDDEPVDPDLSPEELDRS